MKLLLDENLSPDLVKLLHTEYPHSVHVRGVGLEAAQDDEVWRYAREHNFVIVSKDSDFRQRSFLFGHPPKVVGVGLGNCSTHAIETLLRARRAHLEAFAIDLDSAFLMLA